MTAPDSGRYLVPFAGHIYQRLEPAVYPLVRISLGFILVPHGYDKLFNGGAAGTANNAF